jgi:hypothetical protein
MRILCRHAEIIIIVCDDHPRLALCVFPMGRIGACPQLDLIRRGHIHIDAAERVGDSGIHIFVEMEAETISPHPAIR